MIRFYNTLGKELTEFKPIINGKVGLYTCGPTVYDTAHIGNLRAFMFEDLLKRYLQLKGFEVYHVMNITDIDDKTIKRSIEEKINLKDLTQLYTKQFFEDLKRLKIKPADLYPRATEHIPLMIQMVQDLIEKGHAYQTEEGSVYFDINSYQDYGKLTNLIFDQQVSTERIASDEYSKENPQDFALWKSWKEEDGPIFWESPWGKGRPGWHIECSAMSIKYLGETFDIHCGGVDNIFPHHENEIAQSVCATGNNFVNIWMHCDHLLVDNAKMSKSLDNYYKIRDLQEQDFTPEMIRYLLLNTHYRSKVNFSLDKKHEAKRVIERVREICERLQTIVKEPEITDDLPDDYWKFEKELDRDLNTPKALAVFFEWIRKTNIQLDNQNVDSAEAQRGLRFIERVNSVFDLLPAHISIPGEITDLLELRNQARQQKNWPESDRLRALIKEKGWIVEDTPDGFKCKPLDF